MKVLKYPLIVALVAILLYVGLVQFGLVKQAEPTPISAPENAHSNAHSRLENAHSRVDLHTVENCTVMTGVPKGYLNLRSGAGMGYEVLKVLAEGESLVPLHIEQDGWQQYQSGQIIGWAYGKYIGDCNG